MRLFRKHIEPSTPPERSCVRVLSPAELPAALEQAKAYEMRGREHVQHRIDHYNGWQQTVSSPQLSSGDSSSRR